MTATATMPQVVTRYSGRHDLARQFAELGFSHGAEIGVERGHFSRVLLDASPVMHLLCVDAWKAYRGYREHVSQDKLDAFYAETRSRLAPYGDRCVIRRMFSTEAALTVTDGSLDFVYIDGNHVYAQVMADIKAWAPKVRSGGIVSGHDYCRRKRMDYGVIEAVTTYAVEHGIESYTVLRGDKSPSWMWVQP